MQQQILEKILLVEDEEDIRTIAQVALEDIGKFTLKLCSSGQQALDVAKNFKPDLVLLDVMMPGMDGLTTLQELRKISSLKNVPVIFMTAKVQPQEIEKYRQLGILDVITKPFDPMTLADTIRDCWSKQYGQEPS